MAESIAPEDRDYVCSLDEASLNKAIKELNEDPKNRLGAVDTFRTWIKQQKHIKCPTDTKFLLAFLRARKFSQLEARKLLENFLTRRCKLKQWFQDMDPANPKLQAAWDNGMVTLVPGRDSEGRRIFILRPGQVDISFKKYKKDHLFQSFACVLDALYLDDEMTQVNGTITLIDFTGFTHKINSAVSIEDRKAFLQTWQKNYPARIKQLHMYNTGAFMEFILTIVKMAMSEKIQSRLTIHGQVLEGVYKSIPMNMLPDEYHPDDYEGPSPGSFKQIIDGMKESLTQPSMRSRLKYVSSSEHYIKLSEKPQDVPEASFRKLNVD